MILQQLYEDSEAILQDCPTPPMYDNILVQWEVQLTADGKLKGDGFVNLGEKGGSRHCVPYNYGPTGTAWVPNLLMDTADYALGPIAAPQDENAGPKHQAFSQPTPPLLRGDTKPTGSSSPCMLGDEW